MHILLIADGRSPIARDWIRAIAPLGYQISLVSTFPCAPVAGADRIATLPVAFARQSGSQAGAGSSSSLRKKLISALRPLLANIRHLLGPFTLPRYQKELLRLIDELHPDLVHALRIPYEGMLGSVTPRGIPFIVSTWGNDLTLHAPANARMRRLTRQTLQRANGLISDTACDVPRALEWGFDPRKPVLVAVGNGGLDLEELRQIVAGIQPVTPPQVLNPRGMRSYVRNDTFFRAIPLVLARHPETQFVCPSMAGQKEALAWVEKLGIQANVRLLPYLNLDALLQETVRSTLSVSVSSHDGTPITLIEAMALGCLPICGDLPSIREWIEPGLNGLLVPANDPAALADAICQGLENHALRESAAMLNKKKIEQKASLAATRSALAQFFAQFVPQAPSE